VVERSTNKPKVYGSNPAVRTEIVNLAVKKCLTLKKCLAPMGLYKCIPRSVNLNFLGLKPAQSGRAPQQTG
jgi:hypothetical protein